MLRRDVNPGKGSPELRDAVFIRMAGEYALVRESGGTAYRAIPSSYIDTATIKHGDKLLVRVSEGHATIVTAYSGSLKSLKIDTKINGVIVAEAANGSINGIPISQGITILGDDGILVETNEYESKIIITMSDNLDLSGKNLQGIQSISFANNGKFESQPDGIALIGASLFPGGVSDKLATWELSDDGDWRFLNRPDMRQGVDFTRDYFNWHSETGALVFKLNDEGVTIGLPGSDNQLTVTIDDGLTINGESIITNSLDAESIGPKLTAYISEIAGENPMYFDATYPSYDGTSPWDDLIPADVYIALVLSRGIELWAKAGSYGHTVDETLFEANNDGVRLGSGSNAVTVDNAGNVSIPADLFVGGELSVGEAIKVLQPGTNWNSASDPDDASGIVIFVDASDGAALAGYNDGIKQAYFDSFGNIGWSHGFGIINEEGQTFYDSEHSQFVTPTTGIGLYENYLTGTESFDGWEVIYASVSSPSIIAPNGNQTTKKFTPNASPSDANIYQKVTFGEGSGNGNFTFSVWLKSDTGNETVWIGDVFGSHKEITITGDWKRYSHTFQLRSDNNDHVKFCQAGIKSLYGTSFLAWGAQLTKGNKDGVYAPGKVYRARGFVSGGNALFTTSDVSGEAIRISKGYVFFLNGDGSSDTQGMSGIPAQEGNGVSWVDAYKARYNDGNYTTVSSNTEGQVWSKELKCSYGRVGGNVAPYVPVTGIKVSIKGHTSSSNWEATDITGFAKVIIGGVESDWIGIGVPASSDETIEYGDDTYLWGFSDLTGDDVSSMQVKLTYGIGIESSGENATMYIDYVTVTTYYASGIGLHNENNKLVFVDGTESSEKIASFEKTRVDIEQTLYANDGIVADKKITITGNALIIHGAEDGTGANIRFWDDDDHELGQVAVHTGGTIEGNVPILDIMTSPRPYHDSSSKIKIRTFFDTGNTVGAKIELEADDGILIAGGYNATYNTSPTITLKTQSDMIVIDESTITLKEMVDGSNKRYTNLADATADTDAMNRQSSDARYLLQDGSVAGATSSAQEFGTNGITTDKIGVSTTDGAISIYNDVVIQSISPGNIQFKVKHPTESYQYFSVIPTSSTLSYTVANGAMYASRIDTYTNDPGAYALAVNAWHGNALKVYSSEGKALEVEAVSTASGTFALLAKGGEYSLKIVNSPIEGGGQRYTNLADATSATDALNRQTGDSRYLQDAPSDGDQYVRKDGAWVVMAGVETPNAPTSLTLSEEIGNKVKVQFSAPATGALPDHYEVWMSHDDSKYYLIAQAIHSGAAGSTQVVYDESYTRKTTNYYKVYSVANGEMSPAVTGNITTTQNASSPTNVKQVAVGDGFLLTWEDPNNTRLYNGVEIKMDHASASGDLDESSATTVYSGRANSYREFVSTSDADDYFQFWFYPLTRT